MKLNHKAQVSFLCLLAVILVSCNRAKDATTDTTAASSAAKSTKLVKGTLPPGWESMTSAEMQAQVANIYWTTPTVGGRNCASATQCPVSGKIQTAISANVDAQSITAQNAGTGTVIAYMDLRAPYKTQMYKLVPGNFTYYVVVAGTGSGNAMGWKIVQVNDDGKGPISIIESGELKPCVKGEGPNGPPAANWDGCEKKHVKDASFQARVDSGGDSGGEQPGWLSCSEGCCTLSLASIASIGEKAVALHSTASSKSRMNN